MDELDDVIAAFAAGPIPRIVEPGDGPEMTLIPYEKQYRVPEALLGMESAVAKFLDVHPDELVCLEGRVGEKGFAAVFEQRTGPAEETIARHVVAKHDGMTARLHVVMHQSPEIAFARFRIFAEEVT